MRRLCHLICSSALMQMLSSFDCNSITLVKASTQGVVCLLIKGNTGMQLNARKLTHDLFCLLFTCAACRNPERWGEEFSSFVWLGKLTGLGQSSASSADRCNSPFISSKLLGRACWRRAGFNSMCLPLAALPYAELLGWTYNAGEVKKMQQRALKYT